MVVEIDFAGGEAEQIVDFFLREDALAAVLAAAEVAAAGLDHSRPLQRHLLREFVGPCGFGCGSGILEIERGFPLRGYCSLTDRVVPRHCRMIRVLPY